MATETVTAPPGHGTEAGERHVARLHVPARSLRSELRAIKVVWQRELIRFSPTGCASSPR